MGMCLGGWKTRDKSGWRAVSSCGGRVPRLPGPCLLLGKAAPAPLHFVNCSQHSPVWSNGSCHFTWSCLPVIGIHCEVGDLTDLVVSLSRSFLTGAMGKRPLSFSAARLKSSIVELQAARCPALWQKVTFREK